METSTYISREAMFLLAVMIKHMQALRERESGQGHSGRPLNFEDIGPSCIKHAMNNALLFFTGGLLTELATNRHTIHLDPAVGEGFSVQGRDS